MVVAESEMNSQQGELELPEQQDDNSNKNHPFSSLGRKSLIYSLTLDEFQHTLCESGKNFGSMNMDEFLSSIWSADENQATTNNNNNNNNSNNLSVSETSTEKGMMMIIRKQPSLPRQGSLTIPAPLCRKTVDEVWSEIHNKGHQSHQQNNNNNGGGNARNTDSAPRQSTFGEMTLEDFLVKAGVVREPCANAIPIETSSHHNHNHHQQQQYGMHPNNNNLTVGPTLRPVMGNVNVVAPPYQGGRVVNVNVNGGGGGDGYGTNMGMAMGAHPVSPNSPDCQFGMEMGLLRIRGRKRGLDGPVEKVVERRQRRMIKNRESAARSRARKQAYTVELEAELNQLKEDNAKLKLALVELERRRKQQCLEEGNGRVHTNGQKAKKKLRSLRRNLSCPL